MAPVYVNLVAALDDLDWVEQHEIWNSFRQPKITALILFSGWMNCTLNYTGFVQQVSTEEDTQKPIKTTERFGALIPVEITSSWF